MVNSEKWYHINFCVISVILLRQNKTMGLKFSCQIGVYSKRKDSGKPKGEYGSTQ